MTGILVGERRGIFDTNREEDYVEMEAEIAVI